MAGRTNSLPKAYAQSSAIQAMQLQQQQNLQLQQRQQLQQQQVNSPPSSAALQQQQLQNRGLQPLSPGNGISQFYQNQLPLQQQQTVQGSPASLSSPSTSSVKDTTPPDTAIVSVVDGNSAPVQNGGTTQSNKIAFTIQGVDNVGVAGFQCSLDNAQPYVCTSSFIFNNLKIGSHLLQARAVDAAGSVDSTPAVFRWNIIGLESIIGGADGKIGQTASLSSTRNPLTSAQASPRQQDQQAVSSALPAPKNTTSSSPQLSSTNSAVLGSTQVAASGSESQFSGSHDTYKITYGSCPDDQGRYIDICSSTIKAHSVYSGTLSLDHSDGPLDFYRPTPGAPMGTCEVELGGEDITRGITFPSQFGQSQIVGDDETGQPLPSQLLPLNGRVEVHHSEKTIGMGMSVLFSSYCYGGLSESSPAPYSGDGVLTASGGDSSTSILPPLTTGAPEGRQTESNQWSVTIIDGTGGPPPCPSSSSILAAPKRNTGDVPTAAPVSSPTASSILASSSPSTSSSDICGPPKISVQVEKQELNPYPQPGTTDTPVTIITVTGQKADGTPLSGAQVKVDACTDPSSYQLDGHLHDAGHNLCQDDRPKANLEWPASTPDFVRGNPMEVTLGTNGQADIRYYSPSITDSSTGKQYYISGVDKIIATLSTDASIKDDTKTITTKVPGLEPIRGSAATCPAAAGDGYTFRPTNNHGCLYYATPFTNNKMEKIGHQYADRQTACASAYIPATASACDVTPANSNQKSYVTIPKGAPAPSPMVIMAMSLPWGGFHDLGPGEGIDGAQFWNLPFGGLEDGYDSIMFIRDLLLTGDNARLQLLRDTIVDNRGQLPYATEGGDMAQTQADFHTHFVPNEQTDFSISCPDGPRGPPGRTGSTNPSAIKSVCTIESFGGFTDQIDLTCAPMTDNTHQSQPITCKFDPASVVAAKDFFTTANMKVSIPENKPLARYTLGVTARAHNQNIAHTTTVTLTCGLCLPPTERTPIEPMHVSDKGYQFTKDKEGFNGLLHRDCTARVTTSCHITQDRYGLYQDSSGFCTRGIGLNIPYGHRACTQDDIDNYHDRFGNNGETRSMAEGEQHDVEDDFARQVNQLLEVQLTQYEFDAVVDYAFNHGAGNFKNYLMSDINRGHCDTATISADFRHPGPVDPREAQQVIMFNNGIYPPALPNNMQ